jgi:hypothetical protein
VVKVSVEVCSGAARFVVAVRAESVQRAVSLVRGRYLADDCRVKFSIDPEGFFVKDAAAQAWMIETKPPAGIAA